MSAKNLVVASVSDSHVPKYLDLFKKAVESFDFANVDFFVLAGDMILKGRIGEYSTVLEIIRSKYKGPLYAVFGNEEYQEQEEKLIRLYRDVVWLNDSLEIVKFKGFSVGIVGSRGVLDKPTFWQAKHIPEVRKIYSERVEKLRNLLRAAKQSCDFTLLVLHYAVVCDTLKGENPKIWPYLGSKRVRRIIEELKPNAVIHGHSHKSINFLAFVDGVPVYNVALPATRKITLIKLEKSGLLKFF